LVLAGCQGSVDSGEPELDSLEEEVKAPPRLSWPRVQSGDNDRDVVTVQYLLRQHGVSVAVDGSFGAGTVVAVRRFQAARGLTADAVIGESTWRALLVNVRREDSGDAVRALQDLLLNRYATSLGITGLFGATTSERVRGFQRLRCLAQTGEVGLYTWNALVANRSYCPNGGSSAQQLFDLNARGVAELWDQTFGRFDGASPLDNVRDAAAGRPARTSCYGGAPCDTVPLRGRLLDGMAQLATRFGHRYFITAIAGASHSPNSLHYDGRAADFGEVDGVTIYGDSAAARALMNHCYALGAIEVFGPSNDPAGHNDHVHCAF
jgi:peptidoglycan hydrolase-like protein with peptidoglycan-binding domain